MLKNISILGSTGSIGRGALDLVRRFPGRFRVVGLAAGRNLTLLREQIEAFNPLFVSVADPKLAGDLVQSLPAGWGERVVSGNEGNKRIATLAEADLVVSAIVGAAGLLPTLAAVEAGKAVALANKEALVMAGNLMMEAVRSHKVSLTPIDSEHSAIAQALAAGRKEDLGKILLTASGGPFREMPERELWAVTPERALRHPNWEMGTKITIDSATLMNKGLEVIEARWLFDVPMEKIEVVIHPQSIIHSMVEFIDGSVVAQMGIPDMRIPIAYALSFPERLRTGLPCLQLPQCEGLTFFQPDLKKFPALRLAYQVCKRGGTSPAILNAANEVAVAAFLAERIRFPEIPMVVAETLRRVPIQEAKDVAMVLAADLSARVQAESLVEAIFMQNKQKSGEEIPGPPLPEWLADRVELGPDF